MPPREVLLPTMIKSTFILEVQQMHQCNPKHQKMESFILLEHMLLFFLVQMEG